MITVANNQAPNSGLGAMGGGFGGGWGDPSQLPDWLQRIIAYQNSMQPVTGAAPPEADPRAAAIVEAQKKLTSPGMVSNEQWPSLAGAGAIDTSSVVGAGQPPAAPSYPDPTFGRGQPPNTSGPEWRNMPWPSQVNPTGQHPVQTAIAANATPGGRDITVKKAKTPFTQIAAPNQDPLSRGARGALGQGGGSRMISALDLSSLFGNVPNPA